MSRALVTGGASGLGLALTKALLAQGDSVLVGDLAESRPESVPGDAAYLTLDVRSEQDWDAAREWVEREWDGLDLLVNNAGVATGGRIDVETLQDWDRVLDINLLGVVRGCRTFTPVLKRQRGGRIVNVASLAGLIHGPGMSSYNAAKAAVVAVSETLGFELDPWGVKVSVVCPSFFRTNLHESMRGADVAMESTATGLITEAPYTAAEIAAAVLHGVEADTAVIVPDEIARSMVALKRHDPEGYAAWGRDGAARLARRELAQ